MEVELKVHLWTHKIFSWIIFNCPVHSPRFILAKFELIRYAVFFPPPLRPAANTHVHADHITGSGKLKHVFPSTKSILSVHSGAKSDVKVKHGALIDVGGVKIEVRATPGHTNGTPSQFMSVKKHQATSCSFQLSL
jgi:glyoxylase-like metal-dependent hydrolase (beta-lactamase superfamily II)